MKILSSRLEQVAVHQDQYPPANLPEIAFVGRSNVGKSSFINSLILRKNLARTSSKPGKTRTINFYNVNEAFRLVDLPGYGYAQVNLKEREHWQTIISRYLDNRENLAEIILLVDMRHEPTSLDCHMYQRILSLGYKGYVVATKADKLSKGKWLQQIKIIADKLKIRDKDLLIPYSIVKNSTMGRMYALLENVLDIHPEADSK